MLSRLLPICSSDPAFHFNVPSSCLSGQSQGSEGWVRPCLFCRKWQARSSLWWTTSSCQQRSWCPSPISRKPPSACQKSHAALEHSRDTLRSFPSPPPLPLSWHSILSLTPSSFLPLARQAILCCAFSPDCKLLMTGSGDATLRLWEISTEVSSPPSPHSPPP